MYTYIEDETENKKKEGEKLKKTLFKIFSVSFLWHNSIP